MNINTSIGLGISNEMNGTTRLIQRSLERLSTGKRVNSPRDDAAGYSMSVNLTSQIRGLQQANLNINQAVGLLQTADAAISVQTEIVQRMRELAVQSGNGALSESDRSKINSEMLSLVEEFGRITNETEFNGMKLLDGSFGSKTLQIGANDSSTLDVEIGNFQASSIFEKTVGQGTFKSVSTVTVGDTPADIAFADFNGDGVLDMVSADNGTSDVISVSINQGDGTFNPEVTQSSGGTSVMVRTGDVNGDGAIDIIVSDNAATESIDVYINNGDGTFKSRVTYTATEVGASEFNLADMDNDGDLDIVAGTETTSLEYFENNGDGTFQDAVSISLTTGVDSDIVKLADLNGDGNQDIVTFANGTGIGQVLLGDGSGSFTLQATSDFLSGTATGTFHAAFGDINNDGYADMISAGTATSDTVEVRLSDGAGSWQTVTTFDPGADYLNQMILADFNNDGNLDLMGRNTASNTYSLYLGNGAGGFNATAITGSASGADNGMAAGDLNGDGVVDFALVENGTDAVWVLLANTKQQSALADLVTDDPADAEVLIQVLDDTLDTLNEERTNIAISMGRLEQAASYNGSMEEAYTESRSLIEDADIGLETSELVRNQILQQAQIAALSQANANAQVILGLLQI